MLFGENELGADVDLAGLAAPRLDALLYGESQGRVIACVAAEDEDALVAAARAGAVPADSLGSVSGDGMLSVSTPGGRLEWGVRELRTRWESSIENAMKRPGLG